MTTHTMPDDSPAAMLRTCRIWLAEIYPAEFIEVWLRTDNAELWNRDPLGLIEKGYGMSVIKLIDREIMAGHK